MNKIEIPKKKFRTERFKRYYELGGRKLTFVYLMTNQKPIDNDIIKNHVDYLRALKSQGKLIICGPFTDYPGGMVMISAENIEEATDIAKSDPLIASGCKSFEVRTLEVANEENNYLL